MLGRPLRAAARLWRDRLSIRLVSAVLGLTIACTAALTWHRYHAAAVALDEQLSGIGTTLVDTIAFSCDDKIVLEEIAAIEALVDLVLTEKGVALAWVQIERTDGKVLNIRNAPSPRDLARTDIRVFSSQVLLRPEGRLLGVCRIGMVETPWLRMLEERAVVMVLQNIAAFGIIAAVMGLLLHRWLGLPMNDLDGSVRRLAAGQMDQPIPLVGTGQLSRLAATLETMRTNLQASHASLSQQNERLLELDRLKDQFLSSMSHEIRTPLTAVLSGIEVLPTLPESERAAAQEAVLRNAQHLLCLVNQVLDFSKLQSGSLALEKGDVALRPLVADLLAGFRPTADGKQLSLRFDWRDNAPDLIHTDALRLRQILMNLVGNALKFTERGGVIVEVTPAGTTTQPTVEITVADSGIGIPAEHFERLFTPFSQGDASMTRRFGGTGLGLVISRQLARALGGELTITSQVEPEPASCCRCRRQPCSRGRQLLRSRAKPHRRPARQRPSRRFRVGTCCSSTMPRTTDAC